MLEMYEISYECKQGEGLMAYDIFSNTMYYEMWKITKGNYTQIDIDEHLCLAMEVKRQCRRKSIWRFLATEKEAKKLETLIPKENPYNLRIYKR